MKSRKLLGVTALFYTDKKCKREWNRLWGSRTGVFNRPPPLLTLLPHKYTELGALC
eukprot:COSAG01_NODE_11049_length_2020_cov_6.391983_2_plen_56_part_00